MTKLYNELYTYVASNLIETIILIGIVLVLFMLFLIIVIIVRGNKLKKLKMELQLTNDFVSEERVYDIVNAVVDHKYRENLKETASMIRNNIIELEETVRLPELSEIEELNEVPLDVMQKFEKRDRNHGSKSSDYRLGHHGTADAYPYAVSPKFRTRLFVGSRWICLPSGTDFRPTIKNYG